MKIIDLLNKIANGEEVPEEIKYNNINYYWCNQCKIYERIEDVRTTMYFRTKKQEYFSNKQGIYLEDLTFDKIIGGNNL